MQHMDSDLVCPARLKHTFHHCHITEPFKDGIVCHGMFALGGIFQYSHLKFVFGIAAYIARNRALVRIKITPYQRDIFPFGRFVKKLFSEHCLGLRGFGHYK